jgi:cysteine desulfurase
VTAAPVYLDWNASAPLHPAAQGALMAALGGPCNPSSVHRYGRAARQVIESARREVAGLVGARPNDVVFTSGATEANALALSGSRWPVAVVATEHASVLEARPDAVRLPVDPQGVVRLDALDRLLADRGPMLVSVMAANNETGVIQPVAEVAARVHRHGGFLHCDAVQAAGRVVCDRDSFGADLLTLSGHKLGAVPGIGALVTTEAARPVAMVRGGGQEFGARAGTENVPGIAAFGAVAASVAASIRAMDHVADLRDRLERDACRLVPATRVIGAAAARLPNTSCLSLPGVAAATLVMAMDLAGVAISAGAACASGKVRRSHVLAAMDVPEAVIAGAIRVSLGPTTKADEIDIFLREWARIGARAVPVAA